MGSLELSCWLRRHSGWWPENGLLYTYSKSGAMEKKTECFSILFLRSEYELVSANAEQDSVIAAKLAYMKPFL